MRSQLYSSINLFLLKFLSTKRNNCCIIHLAVPIYFNGSCLAGTYSFWNKATWMLPSSIHGNWCFFHVQYIYKYLKPHSSTERSSAEAQPNQCSSTVQYRPLNGQKLHKIHDYLWMTVNWETCCSYRISSQTLNYWCWWKLLWMYELRYVFTVLITRNSLFYEPSVV